MKLQIALVVALTVLFIMPSNGSASAPAGTPSSLPALMGAPHDNLTVGPEPVAELSPMFWGTTVSARARILSIESNVINTTHTTTVVWPGGNTGDDYDPLTNTIYTPSTTASQPRISTPITNESGFVSWCRVVHCNAIIQLPAEINNATIAGEIVNYTVHGLGFQPTYFELGNEPELWKHWNETWPTWSNLNIHFTTPLAYAQMVQRYVDAIRAADPTARIIGLAGTGGADGNYPLVEWLNETVWLNGPEINGIAFHEYPTLKQGPEGLPIFYESLQTYRALPVHLNQTRGAISNATDATNYTSLCPSITTGPICSSIPVFITELGSGLTNQWSGPFSRGFPGGLSLAAQTIQAMTENATNVDIFATVLGTGNSWFNFQGVARPDYTVYSTLLSRLGSAVYPVSFGDTLNNSLYGIATVTPNDQSRADLLLVNTNVTSNVSVTPALPGVAARAPTEVWEWTGNVTTNVTHLGTKLRVANWVYPTSAAPVPHYFSGGLPTKWKLPAQTIALFESYPLGGRPVQFVETGRNESRSWFVSVGGENYTSNVANLTAFLPFGPHTLVAPSLVAELYTPDNATHHTTERWTATVPSSIEYGRPATVLVRYTAQWRVSLNAAPSYGGMVTPDVQWADANQSLNLSARPSPGWIFSRWHGWGPGNVTNNTDPNITLTPSVGRINENATFVPTYPVIFQETGLPHNVRWGVSLVGGLTSNLSQNTTAQILNFYAANGSWGYSVWAPAGYRAYPPAGAINVTGAPANKTIEFAPYHPAPPTYPVLIAEVGLSANTEWNVTVRGINYSSNNSGIYLQEPNGSYGFVVGYVVGYHPTPRRDGFTVNGAPVLAPQVTFVLNHTRGPMLYPAIWKESGLGANATWTVTFGVVTLPSNGSWTTQYLPNGTYTYSISPVGLDTPTPDAGTFTIDGSGFTQSVLFAPTMYRVVFNPVGLPSGAWWGVRLGGAILNGTGVLNFTVIGNTLIGSVVAGTKYSYGVVLLPFGYTVFPKNGFVTVSNRSTIITLAISGPPPPAWLLTLDAFGAAMLVVLGIIYTILPIAYLRARYGKHGPPPHIYCDVCGEAHPQWAPHPPPRPPRVQQ